MKCAYLTTIFSKKKCESKCEIGTKAKYRFTIETGADILDTFSII